MSKLLSKIEIENILMKEKIKIYEFENTELQIILSKYYDNINLKNKREPCNSIRDEYNFLINKLKYLEIENEKLNLEISKIKSSEIYKLYIESGGQNDKF